MAVVSFQNCLQASKTASPIWNLSVRRLVAATTGCMCCTHAWHLRQGLSSTTGTTGGAGRGWQVLIVLQESMPPLQVQISAVMSDEHMGLAGSRQSLSPKHVPLWRPAVAAQAECDTSGSGLGCTAGSNCYLHQEAVLLSQKQSRRFNQAKAYAVSAVEPHQAATTACSTLSFCRYKSLTNACNC